MTQREIIDQLMYATGASSYVMVDEFETKNTRHTCMGRRQIDILRPFAVPVYDPRGGKFFTDVMFCNYCKKLIVNRESIRDNQNYHFTDATKPHYDEYIRGNMY